MHGSIRLYNEGTERDLDNEETERDLVESLCHLQKHQFLRIGIYQCRGFPLPPTWELGSSAGLELPCHL